MKVLDLFSGIGGFSLGLERAGMETVAFCEIEKFPRKVLAKHWPNIPIYEDVRNVTKERLEADGVRPDIVCGGFPCQDISVAGNQKGITAERSGLWSELCRIIGEVRPKYAIVENVTALISGESGGWFHTVLGDLAEIGYDCEWHCISASELGAHHHRDRIWIIAYPQSDGDQELKQPSRRKDSSTQEGARGVDQLCGMDGGGTAGGEVARERGEVSLANPISKRQPRQGKYVKPLLAEALKNWQTINVESGCISGVWAVEPELGRVANGIPRRVDRLKGLGNAVVPQIPELIGRAIMSIENELF